MLIKSTSLFVIAVFIGLTVSPSYSGNIISCDSFETCPDGETSSAIIVELEVENEAQAARIALLELSIEYMEGGMVECRADIRRLLDLCGEPCL
jgi:hypothetical protein